MRLFRRTEKTNYAKIIFTTLGILAALAAIAFIVYKFFFEYKCDYDCEDYLDDCDCCDCDCDCDCCDEIEVEDVTEEAAE